MSIFSRLAEAFGFGKGEVRPQNAATYSQDVYDAFGVAPSGATVTATTAMRVSAVAACVAKISGAIVSMPLHVYRLNGDIPDRLPRDPLWYLLNEQCAPQYTSASMWEGVSMAKLLRGDAFVLIRRAMNGNVKELLPLPWGSVNPIRTPGEGVRYYVTLPTHGIATWFDPSDILHFHGLGFDDATMRSMSVIQYGARSAIGNAIAMDNYSGKFFEGGAHPSIILNATGNDPSGTVRAPALAAMQAYRAALPGVPIIVGGIWPGSGGPSAERVAVEAEVKAAFDLWADPLSWWVAAAAPASWITGTGKSTAPLGDGNADVYVESDGVHPTQAGHDYYGRRWAGAIRSIINGAGL